MSKKSKKSSKKSLLGSACCPNALQFWRESIGEEVYKTLLTGKNVRQRALASLQAEAVKKSPKAKKPLSAKATAREQAEHEFTASLKKPDGLRIPTFLDRVAGKTKEEIDAGRDAAIKNAERGQKRTKKLVSKSGKSSLALGHSVNLDDAGKSILKEEKAKKEQRERAKKAEKKEQRLREMRERNAEKRGNTAPAPKKVDEASAKAIAETTKKPSSKVAQVQSRKAKASDKAKPSTSEKGDAVFKMLVRKNGASNAEFVAALGYRWNIGPMTKLCKERGYKLIVKRPDGEAMRYLAEKN